MKKILVVFLFLITILYGKEEENSVITSTGRGIVLGKPDTIKILSLIESIDEKSENAVRKNNEILYRTLRLLEKNGVEKDEIIIQNYSLEYRRDYTTKDESRKYFVTNEILIISKKLKNVDKILGALNQGGVTNIDRTEFIIEDRKKYEEKAYELAYLEAKERAKIIAKLENKVVVPKEINLIYLSPRGLLNMAYEKNFSSSVPVTIPNSLEIIADINATFYLK